MNKPWVAEHTIEAKLARVLIEAQFPQLGPARLELLGEGWDNTAFLVNGNFVFRFPRRQIAVRQLENEVQFLPQIASRLPLPIPKHEFHGQPSPEFPWPFAGYPLLLGLTASAANLDEAKRLEAAKPLAGFLLALHSLPADQMAHLGASEDAFGRLELTRRAFRMRERLDNAIENELITNPKPLIHLLDTAEDPLLPEPTSLVHGDFYATHLLVDTQCRLSGVIDWGDIHLGHPAVDLAIMFGFLPPQGRDLFESVYGETDAETKRVARLKALESALTILTYGHDVGKRDLVREGQTALSFLIRDIRD